MKKKTLILFFVLAGVILSLFSFKQKLYTEIIINTQNSFDFTDSYMLYSNINSSKIKGYPLSPSLSNPLTPDFVPYSEGFIPLSVYKQYKKIFQASNEDFSMMFQDYYEMDHFIYFAFPGDLTSFRVLDRTTNKIKPLIIEDTIMLSPMYVSHMQQVNDQLIILAGQAQSYNALIYTVDLPSLKVTNFKVLPTHPTALNGQHFTLTSDGMALFIADNQVQVYNPFIDKEFFIPIPFTATGIISESSHTVVYGEKDGVVSMSVLDHTFDPSALYTLELPAPSCKIIDLKIIGNTLFIATVDPLGVRFANYISGYDLSTSQLTYCLGVQPSSPLMLVGLK